MGNYLYALFAPIRDLNLSNIRQRPDRRLPDPALWGSGSFDDDGPQVGNDVMGLRIGELLLPGRHEFGPADVGAASADDQFLVVIVETARLQVGRLGIVELRRAAMAVGVDTVAIGAVLHEDDRAAARGLINVGCGRPGLGAGP